MLVRTHAPGHSALNWHIEAHWSQSRRVTRGQHLGRSSGAAEEDLGKEEVLREVSEAALNEYDTLLQACRTNGKPWHTTVVDPHADQEFADLPTIQKYYNLGSLKAMRDCWDEVADIHAETQDLEKHVVKERWALP